MIGRSSSSCLLLLLLLLRRGSLFDEVNQFLLCQGAFPCKRGLELLQVLVIALSNAKYPLANKALEEVRCLLFVVVAATAAVVL